MDKVAEKKAVTVLLKAALEGDAELSRGDLGRLTLNDKVASNSTQQDDSSAEAAGIFLRSFVC